jgi:hypothetical protein
MRFAHSDRTRVRGRLWSFAKMGAMGAKPPVRSALQRDVNKLSVKPLRHRPMSRFDRINLRTLTIETAL